MMIVCPKCGKQLADGAKFCKFCGSATIQPQPQAPVHNDVQSNVQKPAPQKPKKKKSSKNIVLAIIAVILVIAIAVGGWLLWDVIGEKKKEDLTDEEKLTQILEESTTKPIIEFVYDDYDSDGTCEAYAVVGETDEEDEKHPEFYDADIYFVNNKKAQKIKENVSGKVNGTIKLEDIKYISIEVYEDGTNKGKSFIYTADGTKSVEPEFSGKYSNVHKEDGKIVGFDDNRNHVDIEFSTTDIDKSDEDEPDYIVEPTEEDWEMLGDFITQTQYSSFTHGTSTFDSYYHLTDSDAVSRAYNFLSGFCGISQVYSYLFDFDCIDSFVWKSGVYETPDPLDKFNDLPVYYRYSAEEIDWIIKNVFNVEPDRAIYSDDFSYYYSDEYFYIGGGYAGDIGYTYKAENITALDDGKYEVQIYGYIDEELSNAYGTTSDFKIVATVALKEIDNKRFWSFYSFDWAMAE
ncbi:MAG: zinc ribbon domain-containing protein [Ruminococcaceae bacterium]|nr:zinc ribbon domain-containing protein [Oscillospiraceae bacterium]